MTASIILAEDHVLVRHGLRRIIEEEPGLQVTNEAGDGLALLEFLKDHTPDVVILDISMPRLKGLETAKIIKAQYPQVKIMILTMHRERYLFEEAMKIGVNAYVLKDEADTDLTSAIKAVLAGKTYVSPLVVD